MTQCWDGGPVWFVTTGSPSLQVCQEGVATSMPVGPSDRSCCWLTAPSQLCFLCWIEQQNGISLEIRSAIINHKNFGPWILVLECFAQPEMLTGPAGMSSSVIPRLIRQTAKTSQCHRGSLAPGQDEALVQHTVVSFFWPLIFRSVTLRHLKPSTEHTFNFLLCFLKHVCACKTSSLKPFSCCCFFAFK